MATKAKTKKKAKPADNGQLGVNDLAAFLKKETGKAYSPRELRALLRRLSKTKSLGRKVNPNNRTRYAWKSTSDKEFRSIVAAVKAGKVEEAKRESLSKLKKKRGSKAKAKAKPAKKSAARTKKAPPKEEEVDLEFE